MKTYLSILLLFLICSCNVRYNVVRYCIDGDTVVMEDNTHIRLAEIDCLELHQLHGLEAKRFTESLILGKEVKLVITETDKYKRKIAKIYYKGRYINEEIVKAGYCFVYKPYSSRKLYNEYLAAKRNRIGLWAYDNQIKPFLYRKRHKK